MATAEDLTASADRERRRARQFEQALETARANSAASDHGGHVTVRLDGEGLPDSVTANLPPDWLVMLGANGFANAVLEAAVSAAHRRINGAGGWSAVCGTGGEAPPAVPMPAGSTSRSLDSLMQDLQAAYDTVDNHAERFWQDRATVGEAFVIEGTAPIRPGAPGHVTVGLCRGGLTSCTVTGADLTPPPTGTEMGNAVSRAIEDARRRLPAVTDPSADIMRQLDRLVGDALAHLGALADGTHQVFRDLNNGAAWAQVPSGLDDIAET